MDNSLGQGRICSITFITGILASECNLRMFAATMESMTGMVRVIYGTFSWLQVDGTWVLLFRAMPLTVDKQVLLAAEKGELESLRRLVGQDHGLLQAKNAISRMTPLMWASYKGHCDVAAYLIHQGCFLDASNALGVTALWYAAERGKQQRQLVWLLLEHGATYWSGLCGAPNEVRGGLLRRGAASGHVEVVRWVLVKAGGWDGRTHGLARGVDGGDKMQRTALWYAAKQRHVEVARMLLQAGADCQRNDKGGKSPLDVTKDKRILKIMEEARRVTYLRKVRRIQEDKMTLCQHPAPSLPSYLRKRVEQRKAPPCVSRVSHSNLMGYLIRKKRWQTEVDINKVEKIAFMVLYMKEDTFHELMTFLL